MAELGLSGFVRASSSETNKRPWYKLSPQYQTALEFEDQKSWAVVRMEYTQADDVHGQNHPKNEAVNVSSGGQADGDGFRSFKIVGLALDQTTPTGMRDEIILLSWLIVLLRTQEDSQVSYDWAYRDQENGSEHKPKSKRLSTDEVMTAPQSNVAQIGSAIYSHIARVAPSQSTAIFSPSSLLLSTSSLSQSPENSKDKGVLHLEIRFRSDLLQIRPVWYTKNTLQYTTTRHIKTLVDTIKMCISNPDAAIEDCVRPTTSDLDEIWGWNHLLPPSYDFCMHDMIAEQVQKSPDKVAISSWDGSLTYTEVEQYSTSLACSLKEIGVELHDVLPVCFEKSKWTIVAVLAVMKSGATFVLLDPTLPVARLQNMVEQVGAKIMLTSSKQHDLSTSIMPDGQLIVVETETFHPLLNTQLIGELTAVPSSALMYIIFTSGSTGMPKGVKVSHTTYTSSAIPRAKAVGYTENSRVLDFASYAFDVSIDSMLLTLGNGGCLCIPSDQDRLNDINGAMRRMQVNYAGLTPSVARILDSDVIASLSGLGLGGEASSARDVTLWGEATRIIIGYGPCECTIGCTVNSSAATGRDYVSIGPGNGAAIWIANADDHNSLMPVGAVGELLVEGPIVGQGYLNDPDKTAAAFIENPSWLIAGHKGYSGRLGRLYKTGDLGKYDPDGSGGIVFVGRKDTQVKLRGQRVELGEIESQLKARLPSESNVVAELIVPLGSGGQPTVVVFVMLNSSKGHEHTDLRLERLLGEQRETLSKADVDLAKVLPRYMIPTAYIPVNYIPALISGKTDRKRLREFGATVDLRQLDQGTASTSSRQLDRGTASNPSRQLNDLEQLLRQAWSETLKLDQESILLDDNFFVLGGDSVTAMRLVSVCRARGLELTVTNIFGHPTLSAMAGVVYICDSKVRIEASAFSMISQTVESASLEASQACGSNPSAIEDIYPCTPTQESLFTFSIKSTKTYVAQRLASIPSHIDLDSWKKAWQEVVAANPILRTRVAQLQEPGLQQVVLKESISWRYSNDLAEYLENDRNDKMNLGESLARYAIINNPNDNKRYMVWTIHHVLYDGWSEPLILEKVQNALHNQHTETQTNMRDFVRYVLDTDEVAMHGFWRQELKDAVGPQFPRLPSRDYLPTPDAMLEYHITLETRTGSPFTLATLIRGAWALVASQYTGNNDVVFGETLTGRDIPLPEVESIIGPLIATLPVRININRTSSVESYLQSVQQGISARTPYQHMGMQNIRKVSRDAQHACEAGTGLVIQPEPEYTGGELGFDEGDGVREALNFNPYPLMLACGIQKGGFKICASFDSSLIEVAQMERILAQLEVACLQLTKNLSRRIDEISCLSKEELNQIWRWNQTPPLSLDESSRRLRADASITQGSIYPRAVIPWVCNPLNSSLLSPIGCAGELWLEGALPSAESVESPPWLLAGSSSHVGRRGRLHPTGDIVQLREDGSMILVGRKENVVPLQGHAVDIADLQAHITRQLPPTIRAIAAVFQPSLDNSQQPLEQELIILIEQQPSEEDFVELMSSPRDIACDVSGSHSFETVICAKIPISLAVALQKLDKFIHDSLKSYMIPSAYVVVNKMPIGMEQMDRSVLNQLARRIPRHVLSQLHVGLKEAWAKYSAQANLTATENILRSSWAKILGISPEQIDVDDNFFRLGGDSVLAMKLVSMLRVQGHSLTVADIFRHMRLGDAARVLKVNQVSKKKAEPYKPFSTLGSLGSLDLERFLSKTVRPKLADPLWSIQDVSLVTDSQAIDVKATVQMPRTSIQYTMLYLDKDVVRGKLLRACSDLVKTHEILRTVFIEDESTLFQVVLDKLDASVTIHQADCDIEEYVTRLCAVNIESDMHLGSPFLKMFLVEGIDSQQCLIIRLSHAQYDGMSLPKLLRDLETLYVGKTIVNSEPFSSYIAQVFDERAQTKAGNYWSDLLNGSSLSVLEGTLTQPTDRAIFQTKPVDIQQPLGDITTANLLTAAWALVLARRLRKPDVTFGSVTSGRNIDLANVENVMGPCYQLTPIRVSFESNWTAMDLLKFVQRQSAESAAYDFLGFKRISKQSTQWPSKAQFFDSIVHHQDFEDFDTMPFAGGTCRVEILNPHGDAAHPLKVVSFTQSGQMHVGVVGSEKDSELLGAILAELVAAVQELAILRPERILLDGEMF